MNPAATAALILLGAGAIGVAAWSLVHGGIGWDSREHTQAALAVRSVDTSWPIAKAYAAVPGPLEFYGVLIQQLADVLHFVFSGSTARLQPDDPDTYLYQGIANLIVAVVAVTGLAAALAIALRSALAGAFAWSLILATPLWLGTSHVNFKDVPVAAGLSLVTAGLLLSSSVRSRGRATAAGILLAGPGGAIVLSTRPGAIVPLVALSLGAVAGIWVIGRRGRVRMLPTLLTAGVALAGGIAFTWATNPFPRIAMLPWLKDSINVSRSFPWDHPIRTAGRDLRSVDLPWWYVPAWLGAQLPLLTLAAVVGGAAVLVVYLAARRREPDLGTSVALVPITIQAVVIPVAIVLSGAVLYDGIRQLLFGLPALLAIPAVALAVLERRQARPSLGRVVLPLAAVVVVAASLFSSIRWAPYAYAYLNPIAASSKEGSWELDYWGVSGKEGVERLERLGLDPVYVEPTDGVGIPWGAAAGPPRHGPNAGLYVFLRWNRAADFGCTVIFTIKRGGHVLGEGARCPPAS